MNFADLGKWGSTASSLVSSSYKTGSDLLKSGAKKASSSMKGVSATMGRKHLIEHYEVTELCHLADGAFGAVVKVRGSDGIEYALKTIECTEGVQIAATLKEAQREAHILKTLPAHQHIIRCYASSVDNHAQGSSTVKLLMEICPGGTLLDYMDSKDGKLSAKEVMGPFDQIVNAVGFLHSQKPGIQHRDLKVENVLMGSDGNWKLCDFGSCSTEIVPPQELSRQKLLDLQEHIDKTVTMLYRPPEMADIDLNYRNGYEINTQVDVWMLGCIMYTLAFFQHPFQDNPTAMAITNGKYFIPNDHPLGKSQKLCGLIHWLLAKDPNDRPTAARISELIREIGKVQYEDLQQMMPPAVQEKIKKLDALFAKRRDTGDIPLPPAAAAALAANAAKSGSANGRTAERASQHPARPSRQESQAARPQAASNTDSFDLMGAIAPTAPAPGAARQQAPSQQSNARAVAKAPTQDLLSLGSPARGPATASTQPPGGGLDDLLGFGAPAAAPAATPAFSSGFADFSSAPAMLPQVQPTPPPVNGDWADFGSFESAAATPSGYTSTPMSAPTPFGGSQFSPQNATIQTGLVGLDFASVSAPTPAAAAAPSPAQAAAPMFSTTSSPMFATHQATTMQAAPVAAVPAAVVPAAKPAAAPKAAPASGTAGAVNLLDLCDF